MRLRLLDCFRIVFAVFYHGLLGLFPLQYVYGVNVYLLLSCSKRVCNGGAYQLQVHVSYLWPNFGQVVLGLTTLGDSESHNVIPYHTR